MKSFLFDSDFFNLKPVFLKKIPVDFEKIDLKFDLVYTNHLINVEKIREFFYKNKTLFEFTIENSMYLNTNFFKDFFYKINNKITLNISFLKFKPVQLLKSPLEITAENIDILFFENEIKIYILIDNENLN